MLGALRIAVDTTGHVERCFRVANSSRAVGDKKTLACFLAMFFCALLGHYSSAIIAQHPSAEIWAMKCIDTRGRYTDGRYDAEANSGHQQTTSPTGPANTIVHTSVIMCVASLNFFISGRQSSSGLCNIKEGNLGSFVAERDSFCADSSTNARDDYNPPYTWQWISKRDIIEMGSLEQSIHSRLWKPG